MYRVTGYRVGDRERAYANLPLIEGMIHVYSFLHRRHRPLLHARRIMRPSRPVFGAAFDAAVTRLQTFLARESATG